MTFEKLRGKPIAHLLMLFVVLNWGFEYTVAKHALEILEPIQLLVLKYSIAFFVFATAKIIKKVSLGISKKDIPIFIACSITGEILYFYCEYTALDYLPISMVTIILAFTPMISIFVERVIYKRKSNWKILLGIATSIVGVAMIIGIDMGQMNGKTLVGYGICICAVISWNAYNFLTARLKGSYETVAVGMTQIMCTICLATPLALRNLPSVDEFTTQVVVGIVYLGIFSAGLGFLIYIFALGRLGPTTNAVYSNFLPVSATFFGWLILGESLSLLQLIGGAVVIGAGYTVIKEKGKLENIRIRESERKI